MELLTSRSVRFWAFCAIASANVIWGINYVLSKRVVVSHIDPSTLTMYRVSVACALLWIVSLFYKKDSVAWSDLVKMFIAALFGVTLNQFLFINGIAKTTPIDAAIIITSNPIIVLLLSAIFLKDKITAAKVVGIIIGAFGAISLIAYSGAVSFSKAHLWGNILILANSLAYAIYLIVVKPVIVKYKSITVMKWVFLFGTIQFLPLGIVPALKYPLLSQPIGVLSDIAFIVVGATFLAYVFTSYALTHIKATTVSTFAYTQPVIAGAFAIFIGLDSFDFVKLGSMVMVFIGVYIASRASVSFSFEKSNKK